MTVYVNGRFLMQPVSGVQRFARELLGALDAQGAALTVLAPEGAQNPGWRHIALRIVPGGQGHLWEQTALFSASRDGRLLSLGNSGPLRHRDHILALHDANIYEIPQAFSRRYRMLHKAVRPHLARRAAALITVSRFSAGALARHLGVAQARFHILPNGADHIARIVPDPAVLPRLGLMPQGYILSVGNQSPNKNIARLIAAHGRAGGLPLVVAGGGVPGIVAADVAGSAQVHLPGRVSDAELRALYDGAAGFVFPSLYEGFGIPPLEAMACGVPVLAARGSALPEVLGDAPIWFDPRDETDMTRALRQFAALPPAERSAMRARGHARAGTFTWAHSAQRLSAILPGEIIAGVTPCPAE